MHNNIQYNSNDKNVEKAAGFSKIINNFEPSGDDNDYSVLKVAQFLLPVLILVVFLDQFTKHLILKNFYLYEIKEVVPKFFNLTLTYNKGAAFGLFSNIVDDNARHLILGTCTLGAVILIFVLLVNEYLKDRVAHIAMGMILGGALGNVIDRIRLSAVVDFLDVYVGNYHWPAFNVADSCICVGVILLLFRKPKKL